MSDNKPTKELMVRVALSVSMNIAKAFLHTRTKEFVQDAARVLNMNSDIADATTMAEMLLRHTAGALADSEMDVEDQMLIVEALSSLLNLVTSFTEPVIGLRGKHLFNGVKAFIMLQQTCAPIRFPKARGSQPSSREVSDLRRYMRFSMASYGVRALKLLGFFPRIRRALRTNQDAIHYLTGLNANTDLLAARWRTSIVGELYKPGYLVLVNHHRKEIVVSIRGTHRMRDALTDMMCEDSAFDCPVPMDEDAHPDDSGAPAQPSEPQVDGRFEAEDVLEALDISLDEFDPFEEEDAPAPHLTEIASSIGKALSQLSRRMSSDEDGEHDDEPGTGADAAAEEISPEQIASDIARWVDSQQRSVLQTLTSAIKSVNSRAYQKQLKRDREVSAEIRKGGSVHKGFLMSAQLLANELSSVVLGALKNHEGYRLVLCGHSLGGAVASTVALMWREREEFGALRCFSYAPPASVSLDVATAPTTHRIIKSIVFGEDVVPRLCLGGCKDVRNAVLRLATSASPIIDPATPEANFQLVALENEDSGERLAEYVVRTLESTTLSDAEKKARVQPIRQAIRARDMQHDKLYPPGKIFHCDPNHPTGIDGGSRTVPNDHFSEIILTKKMVAHHLQQKYAHACDTSLPLRPRASGDVEML